MEQVPAEFPLGFRAVWHRPALYRYEVALPGPRAMWNRYAGPPGTATIGALVVIGRHAYCIKWANPKLVEA